MAVVPSDGHTHPACSHVYAGAADAHVDAYTDAHLDPNGHFYTNSRFLVAVVPSDEYTHPAYSHVYAGDANAHGHTNPHAGAAGAHVDAYTDARTHVHPDAEAHGQSYAVSNPNGYSHTHRDAPPLAHAHGDTHADSHDLTVAFAN